MLHPGLHPIRQQMTFPFSASFALLGMLLLLILTTIISAAESAFFSLSPSDKENLKNSGSKTDLRILEMISKPERLLATLLISLNFVNIALVILSTFLIGNLFDFSKTPILGFT